MAIQGQIEVRELLPIRRVCLSVMSGWIVSDSETGLVFYAQKGERYRIWEPVGGAHRRDGSPCWLKVAMASGWASS